MYKNARGKNTRPYIYSFMFGSIVLPFEILYAGSALNNIFFTRSRLQMILIEKSIMTKETESTSRLTRVVENVSEQHPEFVSESFLTTTIDEKSIIQG
jgi:hypothetical protein